MMDELIKKWNEFASNPFNAISLIVTVFGVILAMVVMNKKHFVNLFRGALVAILIAVLILVFNINKYIFTSLLTLLISSSAFLYYINSKKKNGVLQLKYDEIKYKRFERINEIKYGYIEYLPFFWLGKKGAHSGIGIEVLKKIFSFKTNFQLKKYEGKVNWDTIFKKLENGDFDIILTPLFETRKRLTTFNIEYCMPLFYSNIGLYVKKDIDTQNIQNKLSFDDALDFIRKNIKDKNWKAKYLVGELSESLINKHNLNGKIIENKEHTVDEDFKNIIDNIASGNLEKEQFTFMEVFKVESIMDNDNVINILKKNELLYPVSYVVRKDNTVLKNLINLRLMEMRANIIDKATNENELEKIIKDIATSTDIDIAPEKFKDIFIQQYDFKNLSSK